MKKLGYAYLDNGKILHITKDPKTAHEYTCNGMVLEVNMEYKGGYPVVDNKEVVVYSETEMTDNGCHTFIDPPIKELADLYMALAE